MKLLGQTWRKNRTQKNGTECRHIQEIGQLTIVAGSDNPKLGLVPEGQSIRQTNPIRGRQGNPRTEKMAGWSETGK